MVMQCIADLDCDFPIVCEIGCAEGDGVARYGGFCHKVYCIDPMVVGRPDVVSYEIEEVKHSQEKIDLFEKNTFHIRGNVELIKMCSAWKETRRHLEDMLDQQIDILVIDGCHHPFDAVWKDFEMYEPLVRSGGFVVMDDLYERCIEDVWNAAQVSPYSYTVHERWRINGEDVYFPRILQEVGALRKP